MMTPTLLALALLAAPSAAPPPRGAWVVLVKTEGAVPDTWGADLQKVAERAAQENSDVTIVPPPTVGLSDIQLAVGCEAWGPACAGQVAGMMQADLALTLVVDARSSPAILRWDIVKGDGTVVLTGGPEPLPDVGEAGLVAARSRLRAIIVGVPPTVLVVETDIPGATLFLDGQRVGETPYTLRDLEPGPHKIRLEIDGRAPLTREIIVEEGRTVRRAFVLGSTTTPAHDPVVGTTEPAPLSVSPTLAFSILGGGVVLAAAAWALYGVHAALFMTYAVRDGETQRDYFARLDGLPDAGLAQVASYATYAGFVTLFGVGLLTAASGAGLVVASFVLPGDE
jgi:hypothetical protein